jgi:drug/metabolite transporter (DMT)-like permease
MRKAYLQMHIAILLWGFTAILGKLISLDEGLLVWYRMLFSCIATGILLLVLKQLKFPPIKTVLQLTGIGIIVAMHWLTFYGAIKASNVSVAISCFASVALFSSIIDSIMHRQLPKRSEMIFGLIVLIGVYIIFSVEQLYFKGILLSLISAMLAALFTILNKKFSNKVPPAQISFLELGSGWLVLSFFLPSWFNYHHSGFEIPGKTDFFYLIILSVFCTTLAFTLSLHALKKLDAFTLNLSVNLEPLYSIILAMIIFKENNMLQTGFYVGSLLILSSVVVHSYLLYIERKKRLV